jgi:UDP-glucose 4-epimerase
LKNVLVTGAGAPLGRRMLEHLRDLDGVEHIVGVEPTASSDWVDGAELVAFPAEHHELVELLVEFPIDTVIHCGLAPDRSGSAAVPSEARVIETMRLGAALASPEVSVRSWVIASSSAIYKVDSQAPLLHRETGEIDTDEESLAAGIREAEEYARDVAQRRPHLNVALMRLQHVVGDGFRGPLATLLSQPVLPRVIGYDAPLQVLAASDAVLALAFAARLELAGVYNVASRGTIRLSDVIRETRRPSVPWLPLETPQLIAGVARRFRVPRIPQGVIDILRFGHAIDISKLAHAGFEPDYDQIGCLSLLQPREADEVAP